MKFFLQHSTIPQSKVQTSSTFCQIITWLGMSQQYAATWDELLFQLLSIAVKIHHLVTLQYATYNNWGSRFQTESMTIIRGSMASDSKAQHHIIKSLDFYSKLEAERYHYQDGRSLEISKPSDISPPTKSYFIIGQKSSTNLGASIQI